MRHMPGTIFFKENEEKKACAGACKRFDPHIIAFFFHFLKENEASEGLHIFSFNLLWKRREDEPSDAFPLVWALARERLVRALMRFQTNQMSLLFARSHKGKPVQHLVSDPAS